MQLTKYHSNIDQWPYVNTVENPADFTSRGTDFNYKNKVERWFQVPELLWKSQNTCNVIEKTPEFNMDDTEAKIQVLVNALQTNWNCKLLYGINCSTIEEDG